MYNIDFKVSGDIVSIHVTPSDTLGTLIDQMKKINHFKKFSVAELQDKLTKNLTHILSSLVVDFQIKKRLGQLLNSKNNIKSTPHDEKVNQSISNLNNNTFVNLLQQSTINNSYLAKGISSETKLRRKYISNQNLESDEQFIPKKLKFNYDKKKQNQNHKVLPQKAPKYHHPVYNKFSFEQLNQQPAYVKNLHNNYPRNDFLKKDPQKKQNYHCRNSIEKSTLKNQSAYFYGLQKETVQQNEYNPVPKLNDLIHRSKSLSMINKINTGANLKEKNTNVPSEIMKIPHNLESLGIQKRKTAGKIHHRQDLSTQLIKNELRNENILIPFKENTTKEILRFYERPEFQLKMNYNTDKVKQVGQKMEMRSFIRQKQGKQQKETWVQNRRKEGMKKAIYSYL